MALSKYPYHEFSGALQQKTQDHIKKPNEVQVAENVDFSTKIGSMIRRKGAQGSAASLPKLPANIPTLGSIIAHFDATNEVWAAQNNAASGATTAVLYYWTGPTATDWQAIDSTLMRNAEFNFIEDLGEVWVDQYDPILDVIGQSYTIDDKHSVSSIRQLAFGPSARFHIEYNGSIYAADCVVGNDRFRDRLYKSSGPTGAVSFIRSPQTNPQKTFTFTNQVPVMTSNTAPAGVAAASSVVNGEEPYRAFDKNVETTRWIASSLSGWLRYDFTAANAKVITHYAVIGASTNETTLGRTPKSWTFEGSNDGSSWTTLDTQSNVAAWTPGERRLYSTANSTSYRYYRLNISTNQQGSEYVQVCEFELLNTPENTDLLTVEVDSVRYLKIGMEIDIYEPGTNNLKYTFQIAGTDKINDTIQLQRFTQNFAIGAVDTTNNAITLGNASQIQTGTPITFNSSGSVPTPLSADTTYYAIQVSSTQIKVATTLVNAQIGNAIDITNTGSGNMRVRLSYVFGNKDEIWKKGRKGKLTRFWNTDYRNPEASDFWRIPNTLNGDKNINAVATSSGRLFVFTKYATIRYDGQNRQVLRQDVGCIAHKSIGHYDSFMVWLDASGNVWMRNEEAGEQDVISEAISETMALIPQEQLSKATATVVNSKYKLYLGEVNGRYLRVVYNFRTNQWAEEWWPVKMLQQFPYVYAQNIHPHWFDQTGQLWVDEQGTDDNGEAIHEKIWLGDDTFGIDEKKRFAGIKIYGKNITGTKLYAIVDSGDEIEVGEIRNSVDSISLTKLPIGTQLNLGFANSYKGDSPRIDKITVWYDREEDTFRATSR